MSNIQAVTKQEFQKLLEQYHPGQVVVRERVDGETYEREVYPCGFPPTVYDTFVLYSQLGSFSCYALIDKITIPEYKLDLQKIVAVAKTNHTPIGLAYSQCFPSKVFQIENIWYTVVSRNGSAVPTESECAEQLELGKQQLELEKQQFLQCQREVEAQHLKEVQQANLVRVLSALKYRLMRDVECLQTFPILEKHRPHLQYMQDAQQFLIAQTTYSKDLEMLVKEALGYEAKNLRLLREQYYCLQSEAQDREYQEKKIERQKAIQEEQIEQQKAIDELFDTYERETAAITYDAASNELHTIKICVEQGVSSQVARNRAIHLRTRCVKSLGATMLSPASTPATASGGGATAGAIIGGMLGLLGGPVGIIVGAIAGGLLGNSADNDGKSPPSPQAVPKQRPPWATLIETLDDTISKLPAE